ncbi:hypothetical protein ANCDUO_12078 [Ancylostoma duodenale]|uniref:Uncharacterized protein n=1 Tax=Ancylostoma duodenale TaxID=51022 RepID=A0A0C2D6I0_9BILA|nr:hypothetical protein ANCDUO_12078 [Ancylostoma duodenale]
MMDRFVYRTHVAVEETDFEKKAREGQLKRLKILEESEEAKKKEEEEVTDITAMSKPSPDEDFLETRKYRGKKMQELWEAEQQQIEELREKRGAKKTARTPTIAKTPVKSRTPLRVPAQNVAELLSPETKEDIAKQGVHETPHAETPPDLIGETPQKFKPYSSADVESKEQKLQSPEDSKSKEKSKPRKGAFARLRNLAAILFRRQPQLQPPPPSSTPSPSQPKKGSTPSAKHELFVKSERLRKSMKVPKLMTSSDSPETPLPVKRDLFSPHAMWNVDKPGNVLAPIQKKNEAIAAKPLMNANESKPNADQQKPLTSPGPMQVPAPPPPALEKRGFFSSVPLSKPPAGAPVGQAPNVKK